MSILIKGIDLPEKNKGLYVYIFNGKAEIVHPLDACEVEHTNAEAIQIPKGHGRLIDADKLRAEFNRTESGYCGGWEFCDKPEDFQFLIDDEPTILEAEESQ